MFEARKNRWQRTLETRESVYETTVLITLSGYLSRLCDTYEYGQALSTSETISDKIFVDLTGNVIVSNYRTPTKAEGT